MTLDALRLAEREVATCTHEHCPNISGQYLCQRELGPRLRKAMPTLLAFVEAWDTYAACPDNVNFQDDMVAARKALENYRNGRRPDRPPGHGAAGRRGTGRTVRE